MRYFPSVVRILPALGFVVGIIRMLWIDEFLSAFVFVIFCYGAAYGAVVNWPKEK